MSSDTLACFYSPAFLAWLAFIVLSLLWAAVLAWWIPRSTPCTERSPRTYRGLGLCASVCALIVMVSVAPVSVADVPVLAPTWGLVLMLDLIACAGLMRRRYES